MKLTPGSKWIFVIWPNTKAVVFSTAAQLEEKVFFSFSKKRFNVKNEKQISSQTIHQSNEKRPKNGLKKWASVAKQ